jgi:hypothetical protein
LRPKEFGPKGILPSGPIVFILSLRSEGEVQRHLDESWAPDGALDETAAKQCGPIAERLRRRRHRQVYEFDGRFRN